MPTTNEFKTAVDSKNPVLLRNALVKRVAYCIADDEDPTDLTANADGVVPLYLIFGGILFELDPDDTTSSHDGTSTIVTDDNYRYKATDYVSPYSLLAVEEETPPEEPNVGDAYHIGAAPTDDWVGHANKITVYTSRGWVFIVPPVGRIFYCVADGKHYYKDENDDFVSGIKNLAAANTIPDTAIIGGPRRYIVENQTTNTPPTPTAGVYHIVGGSATGAWAGEGGNIATSYDDTAWTFIEPLNGDMAYDRALGQDYLYKTGQGWVPAAQIPVIKVVAGSANLTVGTQSGTGYSYSAGTAPTLTAERAGIESITFTHAATETGEGLIVDYRANVLCSDTNVSSGAANVTGVTIALFIDSETNARDWIQVTNNTIVHASLVTTLSDTASHAVKILICPLFDTSTNLTSQVAVSNRRVTAGRARPIS